MATSLRAFNKLQIGIESTKGTLVAATRVIRGDHGFDENVETYRPDYPEAVRANVGGAGVIVAKGVDVHVETDLTAEEILWPLLTGVKGAVSPAGAGADKTWTFTPELTTAVQTVDAATVEMLQGDGTTNHFAGEAGYALTRGFKIDWGLKAPAKLSWDMFARARQTTTPTSSLVVYTTREILVSPLLSVYADTSWAGLGGTQINGIVRKATIEVMTGLEPDHDIGSARADLDYYQHKVGDIAAKLSITMAFDSVGATRFASYRANDLVYIRLKNTGNTIGSGVKTVQIDGAYRFTATPKFSADGKQVLCAFELESVYDATGTKTLEFVAINGLAAV